MNAYASRGAAQLSKMGRFGDTHLLHVSGDELRDLSRLGHLSRNPRTGLPEAFALGGMLDQVAQTPGLGFQGGPVTYNPQVGGMSSYGDKGYTSSSSVPPSGYQALSATTPQTQGAFNPTPYKDTGLYQSGGNLYAPQSLFQNYNQDTSNYALGISRSMYDDSGSADNGPSYGDISYMPQLQGASGSKYFMSPSTLGIQNPGEDWMSQIQYNYTDPSTGQQYRNLGSNPFTSVQSVGPVDNTTAAKIGMGLFGGAAIGALAGGAGTAAGAGAEAAGAGAGAAGGAAGGEAAGAGLGSGLTGGGGAVGSGVGSDALGSGLTLGGGASGAAGAGSFGAGAGAAGAAGGGLTVGNALAGAGLASKLLGGGDAPGGGNPTGAAGGSGLLGGALSLAGSNENLKAYEEAQRAAQAAGQFTPYNVYSGMGSTTFGPNGVTSSLSGPYQGIQNSMLSNASGALAAGAQDPQTLANNYYQQLQEQASPYEAQDRANALAQLQAMGTTGLGVGGDALSGPSNPLYSSLLRAQSDAARQRQITAQTMAQSTANQTQQRGLNYLNSSAGLDQQGIQNAQIGAGLGSLQMQGALGGARLAQPAIIGQGATKGGMLGGLGTGLVSGAGGLLGSIGNNLNLSGIGNAFGNGLTSLGGLFGGSTNGVLPPLDNSGLDSITNAGDFGLAGF